MFMGEYIFLPKTAELHIRDGDVIAIATSTAVIVSFARIVLHPYGMNFGTSA
jgi:hypothetical protein